MADPAHPAIPEPVGSPDPERREIRLEIEVPGSPEEVWEAIATGPGITSWYVPHTVEERAGGAATASFGPGPEMQIPGRVAAWEPPHRIVFTGDTDGPGLAFEWLVEARDHGTCVVRLVNSGFGDGNPWDGQYDDMLGGWKLFLRNLWLHRTYFPGQAPPRPCRWACGQALRRTSGPRCSRRSASPPRRSPATGWRPPGTASPRSPARWPRPDQGGSR